MAGDNVTVVIDSSPSRRAEVEGLAGGHGLSLTPGTAHGVGVAALVQGAQPAVVFVAFDEPRVRAAATITTIHDVVPEAVIVAYCEDPTTAAYQLAIRSGARFLLDVPELARAFPRLLRVLDDQLPAAPISDTGRLVVVAGPKGGVGKSTVAVNLASSLAAGRLGSVLLVDLDQHFGDAGLLLDLNTNYSTARAAREDSWDDFEAFKSVLAKHESGAYLLGAPQRVAEKVPMSIGQLESLLAVATTVFDYVLVDAPGVMDDTLFAALHLADLTLLTTSLEVPSARNTALFIDEAQREGLSSERMLVVANHLHPLPTFTAGDLADVIEFDSVWEIPYDRNVPRSAQTGRPVITHRPNTLASRSLRALSTRLHEHPAQIDRRKGVRSPITTPNALRDRLRVVVSQSRSVRQPGYIFSSGAGASVYHQDGCALANRIGSGNRKVVPFAMVPARLRPCRVCSSAEAA